MHFDFLMCSERSGSNLITKILDNHSEVCGPSPSHMTRACATNLYRYGDLQNDKNWQTLLEDVDRLLLNKIGIWTSSVDLDELKSSLSERSLKAIVKYVYEKEAGSQGKKRLFVKENHTHSFMEFLLSYFPEAKFLWMVRDPRDMALTWKEAGSATGDIRSGSKTWKWDQGESFKIYAFLKPLGKIHLIRFEDLLSDTEKVVRGVCDFLSLSFEPSMLEFHKKQITTENSNRLTSWKDLQSPVIKDNFNLYKTRLNENEIRFVESVCSELMEFFGYKKEFDDPGTSGDIASRMPPESMEKRLTEQEKIIYPPFNEAMDIITSRTVYVQSDQS